MHFLIGHVIAWISISIFRSILAYGSSSVFSKICIRVHESHQKIRIFSTVVLKIFNLVCLRMDALQTVSLPGFSTLDIILWVFVEYTIFIKLHFLNLTHF